MATTISGCSASRAFWAEGSACDNGQKFKSFDNSTGKIYSVKPVMQCRHIGYLSNNLMQVTEKPCATVDTVLLSEP